MVRIPSNQKKSLPILILLHEWNESGEMMIDKWSELTYFGKVMNNYIVVAPDWQKCFKYYNNKTDMLKSMELHYFINTELIDYITANFDTTFKIMYYGVSSTSYLVYRLLINNDDSRIIGAVIICGLIQENLVANENLGFKKIDGTTKMSITSRNVLILSGEIDSDYWKFTTQLISAHSIGTDSSSYKSFVFSDLFTGLGDIEGEFIQYSCLKTSIQVSGFNFKKKHIFQDMRITQVVNNFLMKYLE